MKVGTPDLSSLVRQIEDLMARANQAQAMLDSSQSTLNDAIGRMGFQLNVLTAVIGIATLAVGVLAVLAAFAGSRAAASEYLKKSGESELKKWLQENTNRYTASFDEVIRQFETQAARRLMVADDLTRKVEAKKQ